MAITGGRRLRRRGLGDVPLDRATHRPRSSCLPKTGRAVRPVPPPDQVSAGPSSMTPARPRLTLLRPQFPDGVTLKGCGSRRGTRCPACAAVYRADARHLVRAGLVGGKGVPESIIEHPVVFLTLTAPSFGAVHAAAVGGACHPARPGGRCPHGRPMECSIRMRATTSWWVRRCAPSVTTTSTPSCTTLYPGALAKDVDRASPSPGRPARVHPGRGPATSAAVLLQGGGVPTPWRGAPPCRDPGRRPDASPHPSASSSWLRPPLGTPGRCRSCIPAE